MDWQLQRLSGKLSLLENSESSNATYLNANFTQQTNEATTTHYYRYNIDDMMFAGTHGFHAKVKRALQKKSAQNH